MIREEILLLLQAKESWYLLAALLFASLIGRIKIIGPYFRIINTIFHEFGHALAAILFKGKVLDMELFSDTSGTTLTQSKNRFSQWIIAIAGYPFSMLMSLGLFYLLSIEAYPLFLWIILGTASLCLLLWVRNTFGIFYLLLIIASSLAAIFYAPENIILAYCLIIFMLQISDALFSPFILLYLSLKNPKNAGDAKNLQTITGIPAFLWALLFCLLSVTSVFLLMKIMLLTDYYVKLAYWLYL